MKDHMIQSHHRSDDCSLIEERPFNESANRIQGKKNQFSKKREKKAIRDSAAEEIFSFYFSRLQELYPSISSLASPQLSITTLPRARAQILQSALGVLIFSFPMLSLQAVLPGTVSQIMVPSSSASRKRHTSTVLIVHTAKNRMNTHLLSIFCPLTKKYLRRISTIEALYNNDSVCYSSRQRVSYLTKSLSVISVQLNSSQPVIRQLKQSLVAYLDKTLSTDALLSLSFEGLFVEWIGLKEVIALWGRWNHSPFICIFYKRQMALRLAVFDLLSAYTSSVVKVSLIPADFIKDNSESLTKTEDVYLAIYGVDKMAIHRLREAPENRFADKDVPCCTLDHMLTMGLN